MYNIKAAVSRLPFAPDTDEMEVTDIRTGHFVFPPKKDVPVSRADLEKAVTGAGYEIEDVWLEVTGTLRPDARLRSATSGQVFRMTGGEELARLTAELRPGETVSVFGRWTAEGDGDTLLVQKWMRGDAPVDRPAAEGRRQGG